MLFGAEKEVVDLQAKWYEEMIKLDGLEQDQMYKTTNMFAIKHDLFIFFNEKHDLLCVFFDFYHA